MKVIFHFWIRQITHENPFICLPWNIRIVKYRNKEKKKNNQNKYANEKSNKPILYFE